MDIIDFYLFLQKMSEKVRFFLHLHPFRSTPVSLIIEGITYRLGIIVEWTINGTLLSNF